MKNIWIVIPVILLAVASALIFLIPSSSGPNPVVVMDTTMGRVKIELFASEAPITVKNFLRYVDDKHFDGTIFHRVIKGFMIQGGGFTPEMKEKRDTFPPIRNESKNGVSNKRGTIAMARTSDPHSATAQFFINTVDNTNKLDPGMQGPYGYAVFGKVIEGMDVVDRIAAVPTGSFAGHDDVPDEPILIRSIRRAE